MTIAAEMATNERFNEDWMDILLSPFLAPLASRDLGRKYSRAMPMAEKRHSRPFIDGSGPETRQG
jgi:hypothetical protein